MTPPSSLLLSADGSFPERGTLAGIDYGTVRVGIALCDDRQTMAFPHVTLPAKSKDELRRQLERQIRLQRIVGFVVGLPIHANGAESQKSREARTWGKWLFDWSALPVRFFDERYTTSQADEYLAFAGLTKKRRTERRDQLAAQILLTAYLESSSRDVEPGALDDDRR